MARNHLAECPHSWRAIASITIGVGDSFHKCVCALHPGQVPFAIRNHCNIWFLSLLEVAAA
eukprot:scaffold138681_cov28-Tisochrysis_lutea.AAC.1